MKKILFPTDFSEVANNAFLYALHFSKHIKAEIITLHVYELPQMDYVDAPVNLLEMYEVTEHNNFESYKHHISLLQDIAKLHHFEDVKISNVLESGNLVDNIHDIVLHENIDYIVMGTKGGAGFSPMFVGSVTEKVMHTTKTMIAIPEHCLFEVPKNMLFITKFKDIDRELIKQVIALGQLFNSRIDCLYVRNNDEIIDDATIDGWKEVLEHEKVTYHTIVGKDVEHSILDFIEAHHTDMLAMPIHDRGFFQSLFHVSLSKKLTHVKIPILALHE